MVEAKKTHLELPGKSKRVKEKYKKLKELGGGAQGRTYLVVSEMTGLNYCIKKIKAGLNGELTKKGEK